uniref:Ribonuclease P protein subunit p40 n=2 Tax=Cacopsylla melanoneura TaxID=428564 RepID=A0A8D9BWB0_9HEMI
MITPETWDFPPPPSTLVSDSVSVEDASCFIKTHHFNSLVSVTLPDCVQVPEHIKTLLTADCEFYQVKQLPLAELVKPDFVNAFVKRGKLLALSSNARCDVEDSFMFSKEGNLKLSVQPETYQTLGLEGQTISSKTSTTHVITINVGDACFLSSKKHYDRVSSRLQSTGLAFDTILMWTPHDDRVCPSSIAEYFQTRAGLQVKLCAPQSTTVHKYSTRIPDLNSNKPDQVLEWIGALALDCDMDKIDIDSTCSDMELPSTVILWNGLYSSHQIHIVFQSLVAFIKDRPSVPWVSMNVQGFFNTTSCPGQQHYTVIIDHQLECTIHKVTCR